MSTPNPLIPQGTLPDKGKSHVRIAVFTILALHVVLLAGLLIAGCKKTEELPPGGDLAFTNNMTPLSPPDPLPLVPGPGLAPPVSNTGVLSQVYTQNVVTPPDPRLTPIPPAAGLTAAGTEHTVAKGDSFYTLGKKYGVSMRAIAEANPGVDSSRLKLGQKLRIPAPVRAATNGGGTGTSLEAGAEKTYTVKSGDNLGKIAKNHGVTVRALRSANNLRTDQIKVGQKLKIPAKAGAPAPPVGTEPVPPQFPGTVP